MHVLVLGGTGALGKLVCEELRRRKMTVRAAGRRDGDARDVEVVSRLADGADGIVNCAGASVAMALGRGWRGYGAVDTPIGLASVEVARRRGVRLVYVSTAHAPPLASCRYVAAHERVVAATRDLDAVIVRPTGLYSAYAELLPMARRGTLFDIGDGSARGNPIHEQDVAEIVAGAVCGDGPREIACGGPDVFTRREMFEHIAAAAGGRVTIRGVPRPLAAAAGAVLRVVHPRIGQFVQFAVGLSRHDVIAPAVGVRRLTDYLQQRAGEHPAQPVGNAA